MLPQHFEYGDVRHACCFRDLAQRVSVGFGCFEGGAVVVHDGNAPLRDAFHAGEAIHLSGGFDCLPERGDGVGAARVVKRDGDAEFAGLVAEGGVLTLLADEAVVRGHAGNLAYRARVVK